MKNNNDKEIVNEITSALVSDLQVEIIQRIDKFSEKMNNKAMCQGVVFKNIIDTMFLCLKNIATDEGWINIKNIYKSRLSSDFYDNVEYEECEYDIKKNKIINKEGE